jgi:hypothetical protein
MKKTTLYAIKYTLKLNDIFGKIYANEEVILLKNK